MPSTTIVPCHLPCDIAASRRDFRYSYVRTIRRKIRDASGDRLSGPRAEFSPREKSVFASRLNDNARVVRHISRPKVRAQSRLSIPRPSNAMIGDDAPNSHDRRLTVQRRRRRETRERRRGSRESRSSTRGRQSKITRRFLATRTRPALDPIISCPLSGSACYAIGLRGPDRRAVCFVSLIAERLSGGPPRLFPPSTDAAVFPAFPPRLSLLLLPPPRPPTRTPGPASLSSSCPCDVGRRPPFYF